MTADYLGSLQKSPTASTTMNTMKTLQEFQKDKGGWYALTDLTQPFLLNPPRKSQTQCIFLWGRPNFHLTVIP